MKHAEYLDRVAGCLMGVALGDAIGGPFEGVPAEDIWGRFGGSRGIVERAGRRGEQGGAGVLRYTDDTQMTLALAERLAGDGKVDASAVAAEFARVFDPGRGYGSGTAKLLEAYRSNPDWRTLAPAQFVGGSFGNGAAMRVCPVGLAFHGRLGLVEDQAAISAIVTHTHEYAVDGARLVALATAMAMRAGKVDVAGFATELATHAATEEFEWQLSWLARVGPGDAIPDLGNTLAAHQSVGTAIGCFLAGPEDWCGVVGSAISFGGDVDTLAAMAGGICGAHVGLGRLPGRLVERLEDGVGGRSYILSLAERFADRFRG